MLIKHKGIEIEVEGDVTVEVNSDKLTVRGRDIPAWPPNTIFNQPLTWPPQPTTAPYFPGTYPIITCTTRTHDGNTWQA